MAIEWTVWMDAKLRKLRGEGENWPAISVEFGIGKDSARQRAMKIGLPTEHQTRADVQRHSMRNCTVGERRNDAFAGFHVMPDGERVAVKYLGLDDCLKYVNPGIRPKFLNWRRTGWYYWTSRKGAAMTSATGYHGPFSSSKLAYYAAIKDHAEQRSARVKSHAA